MSATPALRAAPVARVAARAAYMMGPAVEREWQGDEPLAWEGMLALARRLRRGAEESVLAEFGLSISMLGITGRLLRAPDGTLRLSVLAEEMGLSLSRVSRVIDMLERRGLVGRRPCPADARATNVTLTEEGAELTARAQAALFDYVQRSFFEQLTSDEVSTLAGVFSRLIEQLDSA